MRIHQCTYTEVGEYLRTSVGIILPTGSTEQHSPMGVLGTDHFCAETISRRVGELASAMVGPSLTVGVSEHHMAFPGSMTIRPSTYIALMRDLILSLVDHGFERFLVINGHGGNTASLNAAFSEVYGEVRRGGGANAPDVRCKTMKWFENPPSEALSLELTGHPAGPATPQEGTRPRSRYRSPNSPTQQISRRLSCNRSSRRTTTRSTTRLTFVGVSPMAGSSPTQRGRRRK